MDGRSAVHTAIGGVANNRYSIMQAAWVLLLFMVGGVGLGMVTFPEMRDWMWQTCSDRLFVPWRRTILMLGSVVTLSLPVCLVLSWGAWGTRSIDGFDDRVEPANTQVAHLLQGEHLVPPPPLPPEAFQSAEVEMSRPLLASADRRWDQMDPEFVQLLLLAFKIMKDEHGYDMALLEGWRSPERQAMLAQKGTHVTMAGAWQSYHQYGVAADCAFFKEGKLVISERDPWAMRGYALYGQVAERLGLTWGGRWQLQDFGHVEWRKPGIKAAMRAARNP